MGRTNKPRGLPERMMDARGWHLLTPAIFAVGVLAATARDWWRGRRA